MQQQTWHQGLVFLPFDHHSPYEHYWHWVAGSLLHYPYFSINCSKPFLVTGLPVSLPSIPSPITCSNAPFYTGSPVPTFSSLQMQQQQLHTGMPGQLPLTHILCVCVCWRPAENLNWVPNQSTKHFV